MKTCQNPNCKTTGIPDEANFCPVCGAQIARKKDKQQLMQEALSAWELYSKKPKNKKFKENCKVLLGSTIGGGVVLAILLGGGIALRTSDVKGGFYIALVFTGAALLIGLLVFPMVAIISLAQDKKTLKNAKNAFIEKYTEEHRIEIID